MLAILKNRTFATLFSAQAIALLGTGLMSVALGLLAYDLAGEAAGAVLGTAYAIKMVAYVGLSPIMAALVAHLPRRAVLVFADLVRAGVALALPFISEIWHVYLLIFLLQAASATFTPVFQASIPDILTDEADYTRALSLSRLAYDIENLLSPVLAAMLLSVISFHWLFFGTVFGFMCSAMLVLSVTLPMVARATRIVPFRERLTRGTRIYLATPRLRGLLALTLSAASVSAFVLVNTVVLVRAEYGLDDRSLAMGLAAYGGGSMLAALVLPRLLEHRRDRTIMMPAAVGLTVLAFGFSGYLHLAGLPPWSVLLAVWALLGMGFSAVLTPSGRLLRVSSRDQDRPAVFAAQFALSHACWLVTYPVAGWVGRVFGLSPALAVLGVLAAIGVVVAMVVWPAKSERVLEHDHPDLPPGHPHLQANHGNGHQHSHIFVIDDEHHAWPTHG